MSHHHDHHNGDIHHIHHNHNIPHIHHHYHKKYTIAVNEFQVSFHQEDNFVKYDDAKTKTPLLLVSDHEKDHDV